MLVWLQFVICTLMIVYGGSRLSHYEDVIAEKTGIIIEDKFLKYDGRPFYPEEIAEKLRKVLAR